MGSNGLRNRRSGYSRSERSAPARPPTIIVQPVPRRSMFRDAAAVAGGVTVGTTVGHLAGEAISSLFSGPRRQEVQQVVPRGYDHSQPPTGPCAYEIATFLQCATNHETLSECQAFSQALKDCKDRNGIP